MDNSNKKTLIKVEFNNETGQYSVELGQGSSVAETAFAVSVIIKCLVRDKIIDNSKIMLDAINKYLNDPQYNEIEKGEKL